VPVAERKPDPARLELFPQEVLPRPEIATLLERETFRCNGRPRGLDVADDRRLPEVEEAVADVEHCSARNGLRTSSSFKQRSCQHQSD
jgi:hypothetical protein